jgi:alkanesulfonate monooxygenase SsuD/methylene tetrahydromethanopterin reductase-like flavin-dependent oxidoreductase (luciferase family)/hemerythrin-like domain-containing protein
MGDLGHDLLFGYFLTPDAAQAEAVVELARLADGLQLDLLGVQDHPYQPRFLDTWTLLSTLAGLTERIKLVPDVLTLPLRPPAVLARAAASLDILSGGRVELGLGTGAFPDGIATMGGPKRSPKEAVDALEEAIAVIRALWTPGRAVTFEGEYYQLRGAQPGPVPPHPIGIWLGSYKPRLLRLTGRLADGWLPSSPYAAPSELGAMIRTIDAAAVDSGRDPAAIRRLYNVSGRFAATEGGFLEGPPRLWVAQLTELAIEQGMSGFLLMPTGNPADDLRRFAEEVAPGVREAVERARREGRPSPAVASVAPVATEEAATGPWVPSAALTPRAGRVPRSEALNEKARPRLRKNPDAVVTRNGRRSQETLLGVHEHLRQELEQIREAAASVAAGRLDPAAARSLMNKLTLRQNYWTLGAFCAQYCRVVTIHHTIEDQHMFPGLQREEAALAPVLDRLHWEHEVIADVLDQFDKALVAMMRDPAQVKDVQRVADELRDALLSHLAYEEDELLEALGRSAILV